ncbi:MAG: histidine phosphatase family protein [Acidimicrobiales bacterium]
MSSRLALIRHGQSRATVDGIVGGERGCRGLTDTGHRQAAALAARLRRTGELDGADVLVSSTLPRAIETAEHLAPILRRPLLEDRALCELHPGVGDGLTWAEWDRAYGSFDLGSEPDRPLSPGGESWAAFGARARAALQAWAERAAFAVLVCHGGIIEQSMVLGFDRADLTPPGGHLATPPNTSITEWRVTAGVWDLVRYADAAHLGA